MATARTIIGLVGKAGAGKSTVAGIIRTKGYAVLSFAHPIKLMLLAMGVPEAFVFGDLKNEPCFQLLGKTARHAMKTLGTEWGRNQIHHDVWVEAMRENLFSAAYRDLNIVIDDVRFLSEERFLRSLGAHIWTVERDQPDFRDSHQSETEQDDIVADIIIDNSGGIHELETTVLTTMELFTT